MVIAVVATAALSLVGQLVPIERNGTERDGTKGDKRANGQPNGVYICLLDGMDGWMDPKLTHERWSESETEQEHLMQKKNKIEKMRRARAQINTSHILMKPCQMRFLHI